jgi:predicted dehydrogenase
MNQKPSPKTTRRDFIKNSSLLVAGGAVAGSLTNGLSIARAAHAYGSDAIRIGLIGCGGRGTGAAVQALNTTGGQVKLVAMADVFGENLQTALRGIKTDHSDKFDVPKERQFVGFDGYQRVLEQDLDLVILATPPGFRPLHFDAAVKAGKHVFMEKPVAVDAPGVRRVLTATEEAKKKNLAVAVGLQRRHERAYQETIKQLQDGAIGDIVLARVYWNGAGVWVRERKEMYTELEYQMRNWYYFNWLCGDHINEQHIHNLDVINWLKNDYPVNAQGQGGREVRKGKDHGQIYDHHFVEYTYADGTKMFSQCRHIANCWDNVSEHVHGTKGACDITGAKIYNPAGEITWKSMASRDGWQQEHHDLFADLRQGNIPNEGEWGAKSTLTAILGRMATYSGQMIGWDDALHSEASFGNIDALAAMTDKPPVEPNANGAYPIAVPGVSEPV